MNNKPLLLCLNGEPPSLPLLQALVDRCDFLVAADGAANWLDRYEVTPDLILGDFDSFKGETAVDQIKLETQDNTDGDKALDWAQSQGVRDVMILGGLGGRADFSLYNLSLPLRFPHLNLSFYHREEEVLLAKKTTCWTEKIGSNVSLLALGGPVTGLSTEGLSWKLDGAKLTLDGLQSQSNRACGTAVTCTYETGHLLVFRPHHLT